LFLTVKLGDIGGSMTNMLAYADEVFYYYWPFLKGTATFARLTGLLSNRYIELVLLVLKLIN